MIAFLLVCLFLAAAVAVWCVRSRLARYIPRKESMNTILIISAIAVLAIIALSPDLIIVLSAVKLLPPFVKTAIVLAAVVPLVFVGCSKHAEAPHKIHWQGPETGFSADTPPDAKPKEAP